MRQRAALWAQKRILNPALERLLQAGLPVPGIVLLETTGRTSGQPRRVPVVGAISTDPVVISIDLDQQEGTHRAR